MSIKTSLTTFGIMLLVLFNAEARQTSEFKKMDFLIGKWEYNASSLMPDGSYQPQTFYSEASYIFGGNALKDDFKFKDANGALITYGSTIRSFDAKTKKWRMVWYNYNLSFVTKMEGEYIDGEFHFSGEGADEEGEYIERITFYDISEDQYSWKSDKSYDGGKTWLAKFFSYTAKRID